MCLPAFLCDPKASSSRPARSGANARRVADRLRAESGETESGGNPDAAVDLETFGRPRGQEAAGIDLDGHVDEIN